MIARGHEEWIKDAIKNKLIDPRMLPESSIYYKAPPKSPRNARSAAGKPEATSRKKAEKKGKNGKTKAAVIKEKDFTQMVIQKARELGYVVAHFRPAWVRDGRMVTAGSGDYKGFLDLLMLRNTGEIIPAELKSKNGRLRPEQEMWIERWHKVGIKAYVWKPEDWDLLVEILKKGGK